MTTPASTPQEREILRSFARRIDPSDPGAHNNLGVLYYQKGLIDEAVEALGPIDGLFLNAGTGGSFAPVAAYDDAVFDAVLAAVSERGPISRSATLR